ncbi:unnamed protein product [Effrenium voratum]|uniref:Calmodulin n=1 Tax=Effrenium voratum TaxID=2562239 RepID=A0AA36N2Q9_9DINO|nr:unnamed protein product [Effrenium voratum]
MDEQFQMYKTPGQNDMHMDRLYELMTSLGYMTIDEDMITQIMADITPYSSIDLAELTTFLTKYARHEQQTIRSAFDEFDEDDSGELSTSEVQAVLEAMGCSPFRGTLQRLIEAVDTNLSGTLDFNEFLSLLLVYSQTDGFSHKEVRQIYRTFCRFANDSAGVKKVPEFRLSAALIFDFGAQAAELARQLAKADSRILRRAKSMWKLAATNKRPQDKSQGLTFRQFVAWSRRMKEAEISEYVRQFKKFDQSQDGVLDRSEVKQLLKKMGYMPLRSTIQSLFDSVDGDQDGTVNLEEYLDVMDYFKKWDGFTGQQAEELFKVFNRFAKDGEISTMQIMDLLRSMGINTSLRKIQQLVAKVDVDETHSLDFKEFLRLMRLLREAELEQARQAFTLTLQDSLSKAEFLALDPDEEGVRIPADKIELPLKLMGLQTHALELRQLLDRYAQEDQLDFDSFVDIVDHLRRQRLAAIKKQACFSDAEVVQYRDNFRVYDGDGSGEIDRDEIPLILQPMGLELRTKEDQRRLMTLISDARKWAAESGVPPKECGKHGTAAVRFPVFLFMCRLLQREKEAKALAEEEEEARILGFGQAQVKKLHAKFGFWTVRTLEQSQEAAEDMEEVNETKLTLPVDAFCQLCTHINPRLEDSDVDELRSVLPAIRALPRIRNEDGVNELLETEQPEVLQEVKEVSFPLFVRSIKWMLARNIKEMQEALKL